jgi:hypothetical protein
MTDAPNTIWVHFSDFDEHDVCTSYPVENSGEYTRTDISQARIAELETALEEIGHMGFDMPATLEMTDEAWRRRRTGMMQHIAREALKDKP